MLFLEGVSYVYFSDSPERYINFYTDYGFKRLFGSEPSKHLLMDFLNSLLESEGKGNITSLTYLKNEQVGEYQYDRTSIYDIYCETDKDEQFIIELQKVKQKFFKDRALYYSASAIREQQRGEWRYELTPVYVIAILDFVLDDESDRYRRDVALREAGEVKPFYDKLFFIYLEMPKFTKKSSDLKTHFEKWMYAIRNMSHLDSVPAELREQVFEEFFRAAEIARMSSADRSIYEENRKRYLDFTNSLISTEERGIEKGLEQGRKEGQEDMIRKFLSANTPMEIMVQATGLTEEQIRAMQQLPEKN